jgi:hypothetical protein
MFAKSLKQHRHTCIAAVAALAMAGGTLAAHPAHAIAAQRLQVLAPADGRAGSANDAQLEQVFWMCDHAAATRMVGTSEGVICTAVADHLRSEKFGGDLEKMLKWWQENKAAQHRALELRDGSVAGQ